MQLGGRVNFDPIWAVEAETIGNKSRTCFVTLTLGAVGSCRTDLFFARFHSIRLRHATTNLLPPTAALQSFRESERLNETWWGIAPAALHSRCRTPQTHEDATRGKKTRGRNAGCQSSTPPRQTILVLGVSCVLPGVTCVPCPWSSKKSNWSYRCDENGSIKALIARLEIKTIDRPLRGDDPLRRDLFPTDLSACFRLRPSPFLNSIHAADLSPHLACPWLDSPQRRHLFGRRTLARLDFQRGKGARSDQTRGARGTAPASVG